jgi:hypothetical protein
MHTLKLTLLYPITAAAKKTVTIKYHQTLITLIYKLYNIN